MKTISRLFQWVIVFILVLSIASPASSAKDESYQTAFQLYSGQTGFAGWSLSGVQFGGFSIPGGPSFGPGLMLDFNGVTDGTDGAGMYNGGSYQVGEATSPELVTDKFAFQEAIASWDAQTPVGTWIETQVRAQFGTRWTKWYNLGVWASTNDTIHRHSVTLQGDADGYVATDTLVLAKTKEVASRLQLKVRLFSADGIASPLVRSMSLAYSSTPGKKPALLEGNPALWNTLVDVPPCSQMVYPDGGNVWCSPTSTSMVVGYWERDPGPCEPRVRAAVDGVYDWVYDGHGNWPFNTAYAASRGLEGYVARFASLKDLEPWIKAGVPVVMSIAWNKSELTGAPVSSSSGHLIVLVGFDDIGNPVVNDPAASSDAGVRLTYLRSELETVWLENSGGTVYLIFPVGWSTPPLGD